MGKHFPTNIWIARKLGKYPNFEVKTENNKEISISYFYEKEKDGFKLIIDRKLSRLLAKRINQCLDETK